MVSLLLAATLLLVTVSGAISDSSQSAFQTLFDTYGQSILDINVVGDFISAGGTGGEASNKPNTDVTQDISGFYDTYVTDERVSHIVFIQAFNDIVVTADGQEFAITFSGNAPTVNELTAGTMPMGDGYEVVVPNSFVKSLGIDDADALGKTIDFQGAIYNWSSGEPVLVPVHTTATIVGVVDATVKYDADGGVREYTVDDSFFFSKTALDDMRAQAQTDYKASNFSIRAKTPADLIAIKDELNANGIVPLGRFELVEDMVRLRDQTSRQSSSAVMVIAALSVVVALAVPLMTALSRRREYAIYRVSGFSRGHIARLTTAETLLLGVLTAVLFLLTSPLLNLATTALWNVPILNADMLLAGVLLTFCVGACAGVVTAAIGISTVAAKALALGEK